MHEFVIRGGRVALDAGWTDCDVGIDGGRVTALDRGLLGAEMIEAGGHWVMPGGIDAHCHLDQPRWGGADTADDFASGSVAAAFGGTTTIVPFAMPGPGMDALASLDRALARADGKAIVDYGLHGVFTEETGRDIEAQVSDLVRRGVSSVKLFMTYAGFAVSDDLMLRVLDAARSEGARVLVHAENDAAIRRTRDRLVTSGRTAFRYHAVAHAEAFEREATHRAVAFAEVTGAALVVVHVSCAQALDEVLRGRDRGADVTAETCPQYLFLTAADLDRAPAEAARALFTPPPRSRSSQARLWTALAAGEIALWSSDHSPFRLADKLPDPARPRFQTAANGVPGLETRLPLLFSEGLLAGRLTLRRYLALAGTAAADLYGLSDRKGRIAIGLDADLALWDPEAHWEIRQDRHHSRVDFSSYEGRRVTGRPVTVLVRGLPVIRDATLTGAAPTGRFLHRTRVSGPSRPPIEESTPWRDI